MNWIFLIEFNHFDVKSCQKLFNELIENAFNEGIKEK